MEGGRQRFLCVWEQVWNECVPFEIQAYLVNEFKYVLSLCFAVFHKSMNKALCLKQRGSFAFDTVKSCEEQSDSIAVNHHGYNKCPGKVLDVVLFQKIRFFFFSPELKSSSRPHNSKVLCSFGFLQVLLERRNPGCEWNPDGKPPEKVLFFFCDQHVINRRVGAEKAELLRWDVTVVAAGENKDLQDPASHRVCEVRGGFT